jgi:hypothetical protein
MRLDDAIDIETGPAGTPTAIIWNDTRVPVRVLKTFEGRVHRIAVTLDGAAPAIGEIVQEQDGTRGTLRRWWKY